MKLIIKGIPGSLRDAYERLYMAHGGDMWPHSYDPDRKTIANVIADIQKQMKSNGITYPTEKIMGIKGELLFVRGLDNIIEDNHEIETQGPEKAVLLHSVQLPNKKKIRKGKTLEPDHIYLDERGIWIIESKYWKKVPRKDHWNSYLLPPTQQIREAMEQSLGYAEAVTDLLGLPDDKKVNPVIVDYNGHMTEYEIEPQIEVVLTATRFYEGIVQERPKIFSQEEVTDMSSRLEKETRDVVNNFTIVNSPIFDTENQF